METLDGEEVTPRRRLPGRPKGSGMGVRHQSVALTDQQIAEAQRVAEAKDISFSAFIRECVDMGIASYTAGRDEKQPNGVGRQIVPA